jgi:peptidoglycan hydrolase CwlO-like protein
MNLKHLIFLLSLIASVTVYGQSKTFVRDYTYRASDADSKITSRQKALKEVKAFLIEELGTYVQSYVNYEVEELNGKMTKDFFTNEIKTFSAGMVETKILEEEWDGYNYYVQAEITADPEEVIRRINETLSVRKKTLVVDSLQVLLKYADVELKNQASELEELESKLESTSGQLHNQMASYNEAKNELETLKTQLAQYQKEEQEVKNEIDAIRQKVLSQGSNARNFIRIGMTYSEVVDGLGEEGWDGRKRSAKTRARVYLDVLQLSGISRPTEFYAIGDTWFGMDKVGLVLGVWEHEKMQFIINASSSENRAYLMKKYNIGKKLY